MRAVMRTGVAVLTAVLGMGAAVAAQWQVVASGKGERIEVDPSRITRLGDGRTAAWNRLVLAREFDDPEKGRYSAVEALNHYDCQERSFTTVKRVYLLGDKPVRSESVAEPKAMAVAAGSVDERLFAEACRLRTVGEMKQVAGAIGQALNVPAEERPRAMHADMLTAGETAKARGITVADNHGTEKPAEPTVAPPKRFIELPKIDKSQVEHPRDSTDAKPEAKGEAKAEPKGEAKVRAPESAAEARASIERQLASSGPRRIARKKPVVAATEPAVEHRHIHWSYEGEGGPSNWSKLQPDYATCASGKRQSPIDIRDGIRVDLEPIAFDYKETQFRIVDNGHTVQVNVGEGSTIKVMGRQYNLVQFHFHRPSEERVNGRAFDMVAHLVHKDSEGNMAVIAVLLEKGSEHPLVQTLWNNLPLEVQQELVPAASIDLNALLPKDRSYMTYMGSMTTPPCTEGVLWMVFRQPVQVSAEQVAIFSRLYRNNARPIQPANGRLVKENR